MGSYLLAVSGNEKFQLNARLEWRLKIDKSDFLKFVDHFGEIDFNRFGYIVIVGCGEGGDFISNCDMESINIYECIPCTLFEVDSWSHCFKRDGEECYEFCFSRSREIGSHKIPNLVSYFSKKEMLSDNYFEDHCSGYDRVRPDSVDYSCSLNQLCFSKAKIAVANHYQVNPDQVTINISSNLHGEA